MPRAPLYSGREVAFGQEIQARYPLEFAAVKIKLNDPRLPEHERKLRTVLLAQARGGGVEGRIARWRLGIGPGCV